MAKREVEEINAGSMADIAFLLLIFFLITTTMNLPQVQEERLPQKSDVEFLLNEKNVLQIMANKNDKIGIEGEFAEMEDIKDAVIKFYQHDDGARNLPSYIEVDKATCEDTIESLEAALAVYPDAALFKIELDAWTRRLDAVNAFGGSGFKTLPNNATVSIQMDNSTKYETYMKQYRASQQKEKMVETLQTEVSELKSELGDIKSLLLTLVQNSEKHYDD